ncbi:PAS domain-containing protein [Hymenobacter sp. GOD-10R]|uniref:PAS domain-containing protein n=1 Tax=Hymenobacter sp. GOD-10R TaxID=3093922 RepID=UPI002D7912DC|nr:PAS domain-containing protein [Hymenobacter sp. GOD-10R]WRQ31650.1 PAS domain-containing protein [Hymenobacter sp. GOD-10R]
MTTFLDSASPSERVEAALEAAGIGVWKLDLLAHCFTCSPRCRQLLGLPTTSPVTLAQALGVIHAEDRTKVEYQLAQALDPSGTGRFAVEHRVQVPGGQVRQLFSTGLALFDPGRRWATRLQGIIKDSTAGPATPGWLPTEQQGSGVAAVTEVLPVLLWILAPDATIMYCNPYWRQYTGSSPAQAWPQVLHPEDLPRWRSQWNACLRNGEPYTLEYRFRRHDGEYRWFFGRAVPLKNHRGHVQQWVGVCLDIQAQKQTQ